MGKVLILCFKLNGEPMMIFEYKIIILADVLEIDCTELRIESGRAKVI